MLDEGGYLLTVDIVDGTGEEPTFARTEGVVHGLNGGKKAGSARMER